MMNYLYNFEFLRIIGTLAIVGLHIFCGTYYPLEYLNNVELFENLHKVSRHGYIAVDLFFIISGILFSLKLNSNTCLKDFIIKKLIRFTPVLIFSIVISALLHKNFNLYDAILEIFCLNGTGLTTNGGPVFVFWYVSCLIFILSFYKYLLQNYKEKNVDLFAIITIYASYVLLVNNGQHYNFDSHMGIKALIFNGAMLRGLGGISLGYLIGKHYKNKPQKTNIDNKIKFTIVSMVEFCCLYFIINNLMLHRIKYENDIIFILSFAIILILFLKKEGLFSKLLNSIPALHKISRYSYCIYMMHCIIGRYVILNIYTKDFILNYPILNILITYAIIILASIIVYHCVEIPSKKYLSKLFQT